MRNAPAGRRGRFIRLLDRQIVVPDPLTRAVRRKPRKGGRKTAMSIPQDLESVHLSNAQWRVFHYIRAMCEKHGRCWASSARIADRLSLSVDYVRRCRGRLARLGLIVAAGWRGRFRCYCLAAAHTAAHTQSCNTSGSITQKPSRARKSAGQEPGPVAYSQYRKPRTSKVSDRLWNLWCLLKADQPARHFGFAKYAHRRLTGLTVSLDRLLRSGQVRRPGGKAYNDADAIVAAAIRVAVHEQARRKEPIGKTIDATVAYITKIATNAVERGRMPGEVRCG